MGKNKKEKPELTLENLNRAIRTYQREEVLYLIQHGLSLIHISEPTRRS